MFDAVYWANRENSFNLTSGSNPFAINQALYGEEQMRGTPSCGSQPGCLLAGLAWLGDPTNDDPESGWPPFHTMLAMFSIVSGLGEASGSIAAVGLEEGLSVAGDEALSIAGPREEFNTGRPVMHSLSTLRMQRNRRGCLMLQCMALLFR